MAEKLTGMILQKSEQKLMVVITRIFYGEKTVALASLRTPRGVRDHLQRDFTNKNLEVNMDGFTIPPTIKSGYPP